MNHDITDNLLEEISAWIALQTGLHFPRKNWHMLKKAAQTAAAAYKMDTLEFLEQILPPSPDSRLHDALVTRLTIGESYFFRDKHLFQVLKDQILRELISQLVGDNQPVNIFSAGCASGEEPYSIAILIDQAFPMVRERPITIIGTDINPLFLEKAEKGIYSRWSLRETPDSIINQYFTPMKNGYFKLLTRIRKKVRFRRLNLMEQKYPSGLGFRESFHIILCRNVLMYFKEHVRTQVLEKLTRLLAINGWLITGPAETGFVASPRLKPIRYSNTLLHRKCPPGGIETLRHHQYIDISRPPKTSAERSAVQAHPNEATGKTMISESSRQRKKPHITVYQEASALYEKGNYASATALLEHLVEKINTDEPAFLMAPDAMILLARSYANIGEMQKALQWCDRAISWEKLNPDIHFFRATILQSAGDIPAAIQALKQALFLDPNFVMAHFMAGLLNKSPSREKSLQNALQLLEERDPDDMLPFSEGMTAARLSETITGMIQKRGQA